MKASQPATVTVANLPDDLLEIVAQELLITLRFTSASYGEQLLAGKNALASFSLVSRRFYNLASPLMWRRSAAYQKLSHISNIGPRRPSTLKTKTNDRYAEGDLLFAFPQRNLSNVRLLFVEEVVHPRTTGSDAIRAPQCSYRSGRQSHCEKSAAVDFQGSNHAAAVEFGSLSNPTPLNQLAGYASLQRLLAEDDAYHIEHYEADSYRESWEAWYRQLIGLTSLRALSISLFGPYNLSILRRLVRLTQITTLCLMGHNFEDWPLHGACASVTSLYLTSCSLIQGLDATFPRLTRLVLRGDADTSLVLTSPLCLPWETLQELELEEMSMDYHKWLLEDLEFFSEDRQEPLTLIRLNLNYSRSSIRDDSEKWPADLDSLVDALRLATNLRELALQHFSDIAPANVHRLAKVFPKLVSLHLSIFCNDLMGTGNVQDYAVALQPLADLEHLECNLFDLPICFEAALTAPLCASRLPTFTQVENPRFGDGVEITLAQAASLLTTNLPRLREVLWGDRGVPARHTLRMHLRRLKTEELVKGVEVDYCEPLGTKFNFDDVLSHPNL